MSNRSCLLQGAGNRHPGLGERRERLDFIDGAAQPKNGCIERLPYPGRDLVPADLIAQSLEYVGHAAVPVLLPHAVSCASALRAAVPTEVIAIASRFAIGDPPISNAARSAAPV
jgi:hypothetical protein